MKRLFLRLLWLALPFVVVLGYVEHRLRRIPNGYTRTRAALEASLSDVEVLLLGSSHAQSGFEPRMFSAPAFNLAYGSQSLYYDGKLVETYAPRAPKLRIVVFAVSHFSFESKLEQSIESWRAGFYRQVHGVRPEGGSTDLDLASHSYIALYSPRVAYRLVLDDLLGRGDSAQTEASAAAVAGGGDVSDAFGEKRVRFHEATMYRSSARENSDALIAACQSLRSRRVEVLLLTTPVHRSYYDRADRDAGLRMRASARAVASACGGTYLDLERDPRFGAEDFINSDHLNHAGAEKLSRLLDEEYVRPRAAPR